MTLLWAGGVTMLRLVRLEVSLRKLVRSLSIDGLLSRTMVS